MSWMFELIAIVSAFLTPFLHALEMPSLHYIDVIFMFVVIPFAHLMNDDETKFIIFEENWYQGLRHIVGVYTDPALRRKNQDIELDRIRNLQP